MTTQAAAMHERLAELYTELAKAHRRMAGEAGAEYVDQYRSPLGVRLHNKLVRTGILPGFRAGRFVLVRRSDIDEYLEQHRVQPDGGGEPDEIDLLLAKAGGRAA